MSQAVYNKSIAIFTCSVFCSISLSYSIALRTKQLISESQLLQSIDLSPYILVELSEYERCAGVMAMQPTTAITFYEGPNPEEYIRSKLIDLLRVNPWLNGCLLRTPTGVCLAYDSTAPIIPSLFTVTSIDGIYPNMPYNELVAAIQHLRVRPGNVCLDNTSEPIFRVTIVNIAPNRFALVCSTSHVICDGHDFYHICHMLSDSVKPQALNTKRIMNRIALGDALARDGNQEMNKWTSSSGYFWRRNLLRWFPPSQSAVILKVKKDWVIKQKKLIEGSNNGLRVSTNDILVSCIFNSCKVDIGCITLNLRGRVAEITEENVGNNISFIAYQPIDYASPELIRQSMASYCRVVSGSFPNFWRTLFSSYATATNWANIHRDINLPQCQRGVHLPIKETSSIIMGRHIIFRMTDDQLGLLIVDRSNAVGEVCKHDVFQV